MTDHIEICWTSTGDVLIAEQLYSVPPGSRRTGWMLYSPQLPFPDKLPQRNTGGGARRTTSYSPENSDAKLKFPWEATSIKYEPPAT